MDCIVMQMIDCLSVIAVYILYDIEIILQSVTYKNLIAKKAFKVIFFCFVRNAIR